MLLEKQHHIAIICSDYAKTKAFYIDKLGFRLLTVVILSGAIWAEQAWSKWWSWDPKETWALITLLVYALPAHGKMFLPTGKSRSLHLYFLFAFLVLLMTYVGTNTLLPGLHSYA